MQVFRLSRSEPGSSVAEIIGSAERAGGARPWGWMIFGLCALGLFLRVLNARANLATPHVDEGAITDQAVAFMGGEWRYYLPEYGPLPMYLLAGVYHLVALARGLTPLEYASRVFFEHEEQYFIARLLCVSCYGLLSLCVYRVFAPRFGRWAAGVSSLLLAWPCLDPLTASKARVDTPQGALQIGALLALVVALRANKLRYWLIAGLCAGAAIACKPLPGVLVLPCFLAASWFASDVVAEAKPAPRGLAGVLRSTGRRLFDTLRRPGLWCSALAASFGALACNPTSLDWKAFIDGQLNAISYYSGSAAPGDHLDVFQCALPLGSLFLLAASLCLLAMPFLRDAGARLIALFPLVYATAFWGRPMRSYYLVAPAMGLCLVIGIGVAVLLNRWVLNRSLLDRWVPGRVDLSRASERWIAAVVSLGAVAAMAASPVLHQEQARRSISPLKLAQEWLYANVPSGVGIYHFGSWGQGPRLVSVDSKQQAEFSDYFEYGREHYAFLEQAYQIAYARYEAEQRPRYRIVSTRQRARPIQSGRNRPWLTTKLDAYARKYELEYIVIAQFGDVDDVMDLGYTWFKSAELVQQFGRLAIFRVPPL